MQAHPVHVFVNRLVIFVNNLDIFVNKLNMFISMSWLFFVNKYGLEITKNQNEMKSDVHGKLS